LDIGQHEGEEEDLDGSADLDMDEPPWSPCYEGEGGGSSSLECAFSMPTAYATLDESEWGSSSREEAAAQTPSAGRVVTHGRLSLDVVQQIRAYRNPRVTEDMIVSYLTKKFTVLSKEVRDIRGGKAYAEFRHPPRTRPKHRIDNPNIPPATVLAIFHHDRIQGFNQIQLLRVLSDKYNVNIERVRRIRNGHYYRNITHPPNRSVGMEPTAEEPHEPAPVYSDVTTMTAYKIFQGKLEDLALHNGVHHKQDMKLKCVQLASTYGQSQNQIYDIWNGRVGVYSTKAIWDPGLVETVSKRNAARRLKQAAAGT